MDSEIEQSKRSKPSEDEEEDSPGARVIEALPPAELVQLLECPVCNETPVGPVWICKNGHNACRSCRKQMKACGICRAQFTGGRNLFMEAVIDGSKLSCPYRGRGVNAEGCTEVLLGSAMKEHVDDCDFGPKINCPYRPAGCQEQFKGSQLKEHADNCAFGPHLKWIPHNDDAEIPANAIRGGMQKDIPLYIIRAMHEGALTPGKLYQSPQCPAEPGLPRASLEWNNIEHFKENYEILVGNNACLKWVQSAYGQYVPSAVGGGTSEDGELLYIGRITYNGDLINGKIHPSHGGCLVGVDGTWKSSMYYEILVVNQEGPNPNPFEDGDDGGDDHDAAVAEELSDDDEMEGEQIEEAD